MGDVIAFRPGARRRAKPTEAPPYGAQILFFLGVRYSRMDEATAARLAAQVSIEREQDRPGGGGKRRRRARA